MVIIYKIGEARKLAFPAMPTPAKPLQAVLFWICLCSFLAESGLSPTTWTQLAYGIVPSSL